MGKREKKTRNQSLIIRLTDDEVSDLKFMTSVTGKNKSDVVREALKLYKNVAKYQE